MTFQSTITDDDSRSYGNTFCEAFYRKTSKIFASQRFKASFIIPMLLLQMLWRWMCKILMPYNPRGAEGYKELYKVFQSTCREIQRGQVIPSDPISLTSYEEMQDKYLSYPFDPGGAW